MGFLNKLRSLMSGSGDRDDAIHIYVQCDKCGAKLDIRVNKQYDLTSDYDDDGTRVLHKEILDDKCFTLMHAQIRFDRQYNIIDSDIEGGRMITREEYETP